MQDIQSEIVQVLMHKVKEKDIFANFPRNRMVTAFFLGQVQGLLILELRRGKRT